MRLFIRGSYAIASDHAVFPVATISRFLENKLQEYFQFIDVISKTHGNTQRRRADLSGFEPESEAPEASVISKLHYRPMNKAANPQKN
jgi:hypothetical protein